MVAFLIESNEPSNHLQMRITDIIREFDEDPRFEVTFNPFNCTVNVYFNLRMSECLIDSSESIQPYL